MKKVLYLLSISILSMFVFSSCKKDEVKLSDLEGTYSGYLNVYLYETKSTGGMTTRTGNFDYKYNNLKTTAVVTQKDNGLNISIEGSDLICSFNEDELYNLSFPRQQWKGYTLCSAATDGTFTGTSKIDDIFFESLSLHIPIINDNTDKIIGFMDFSDVKH